MSCVWTCCKRSCQRQDISFYYLQSIRQADLAIVSNGLGIPLRRRVLESKMSIEDLEYKNQDHTTSTIPSAPSPSTLSTVATHRMTSSLIVTAYPADTENDITSTPSPSTCLIPSGSKSRCNCLRPLLSLPLPFVDHQSDSNPLNGTMYQTKLNTFHLILYGLCHSIGVHIFVVSGFAANAYGGASCFVSFAIGGTSTMITALCLSECNARIPMRSHYPQSAVDGIYPLFYTTFGEVWTHWMAWNRILCHLGLTAAGCIAFSGYFQSILEALDLLSAERLESDESLQFLFGGPSMKSLHSMIELHVIPAIVVVVIYSIFIKIGVHSQCRNGWNVRKYRESEYLFIAILILFLLLFIIGMTLLIPWKLNVPDLWLRPFDVDIGSIYALNSDNVQNAENVKNGKNSFFPFGIKGFFVCSTINTLCFDGILSLSKLSKSTTASPRRVVTTSIITTIWINIALYAVLLLLILSFIPFQSINIHSAFSSLFDDANCNGCSPWTVSFISIVIMAVILFFEIRFLFKAPFLLHQLSADGLFLRYFNALNTSSPHSNSVPIRATLLMAVVTVLMAFCMEFTFLIETAATMNVVSHLMICGGTLMLRYSSTLHSSYHRTLKKQKSAQSASLDEIDGEIERMRRRQRRLNQWTHCSLQCILSLFITICIVIGVLAFNYDEIRGWHLNVWTFCTAFLVMAGLYIFGVFVYLHHSLYWTTWITPIEGQRNFIYITPCFPYLPLIGIVLNVVMMTCMDWSVWSGILLLYAVVIIAYVVCGYRGSKLSLRQRDSYLLNNVSTRYRLQSISSILGDVEQELTGTGTTHPD